MADESVATTGGEGVDESAREAFASLFETPAPRETDDAAGAEQSAERESTDRTGAEGEDSQASKEEVEKSLFDQVPDESEEDDGEPDKGKDGKVADTVPYKRLATVVKQRNDAREQAETAKADLEDYKLEAEPFRAAVDELYGEYQDPVGQLRWDNRAIETLQKMFNEEKTTGRTGEVQRVVGRLNALMKGEKVARTEDTTTQPGAKKDNVLAEDLRESRRERAETMVEDILKQAEIRPEMLSTFVEAVVGKVDLTKRLTREGAEQLIKQVQKDRKWSADFLRGKPVKDGGRTRVPAGRGAGGATTQRSQEEAREGKRTTPKQQEEMNLREHESFVRDRFAQFAAEEHRRATR